MNQATVSSKYQIVIPSEIRKEYGIKAGQHIFFVKSNSGILIIPQIPLSELFGKLKGIDTTIERDEEDRI